MPIALNGVDPDGSCQVLGEDGEPVFRRGWRLGGDDYCSAALPAAEHLVALEPGPPHDDRRKAEDALRESEYKLSQITETQPGLLWSNGPDGEPTHINQRMLDYSGMRFEDFKHRGWEAFVHPAD